MRKSNYLHYGSTWLMLWFYRNNPFSVYQEYQGDIQNFTPLDITVMPSVSGTSWHSRPFCVDHLGFPHCQARSLPNHRLWNLLKGPRQHLLFILQVLRGKFCCLRVLVTFGQSGRFTSMIVTSRAASRHFPSIHTLLARQWLSLSFRSFLIGLNWSSIILFTISAANGSRMTDRWKDENTWHCLKGKGCRTTGTGKLTCLSSMNRWKEPLINEMMSRALC